MPCWIKPNTYLDQYPFFSQVSEELDKFLRNPNVKMMGIDIEWYWNIHNFNIFQENMQISKQDML